MKGTPDLLRLFGLCVATMIALGSLANAQEGEAPLEATIEDRLRGQPAEAVETMLGAPGLVRQELPAFLWLYADDLCVLQVYLYEPEGGGEPVVEHLEARMRGADQPPMNSDQVRACLMARGVGTTYPDE